MVLHTRSEKPEKPCKPAELQIGLACARHRYGRELDENMLRAVFDRTQKRYEDGESFVTVANYEARQYRINKAEVNAIVGAICEMGRFRQGSAPVFLTKGGPLTHALTPANDRSKVTDRSYLRRDIMHELPRPHPMKPEQLKLI